MSDDVPRCPRCRKNLTKVEQSSTVYYCTNAACKVMTCNTQDKSYYVKGYPGSELIKWQV